VTSVVNEVSGRIVGFNGVELWETVSSKILHSKQKMIVLLACQTEFESVG